MEYDAIVLAGGRARRFGGVDKVLIEVGGKTLLERALAAARRARSTVVVGPERPGFENASWLLEDPPRSGPVHALLAGLGAGSAPHVAVLAADLPFVSVAVVERLVASVGDADGAVAVDGSGRDQYLLAVYRRAALRSALEKLPSSVGAPLHRAVASLELVRIEDESASSDCDTPDDVTAAKGLIEEEERVRGVD
jgi:molybdopterin-guanine dinucleotide biosynthesis protein A